MSEKNTPSLGSRMSDESNVESEQLEHFSDAGFVWAPPVASISAEFSTGVEDHRRSPVEPGVKVCLDYQKSVTYGSGFLESPKRMLEVVEHPEEKNHIPPSDGLLADVVNVDVHVLDLEAEGLAGEIEGAFRSNLVVPDVMICGKDSSSASPFGLEAVEAVPATHIENGETFDSFSKIDVGLCFEDRERNSSRSKDAPKVHLVMPRKAVDGLG